MSLHALHAVSLANEPPRTDIYHDLGEIVALVRAFETGTLTRAEWRHRQHLTVALWYLLHHDFDAALALMRANILHFLETIGVDLTREMPYHETLTVFWLRRVGTECRAAEPHELTLVALFNRVIENCADKDLSLHHYTRERLFSDEARVRYIMPDLNVNSQSLD